MVTDEQRKQVEGFFGPSLDFSKVKIKVSPFVSGSRPWTCGNTIRIKKPRPGSPVVVSSPDLIHEFGHVWQHQKGQAVFLRALAEQVRAKLSRAFDPYNYRGPDGVKPPRRLSTFLTESQAQIIAEYWKSQNGFTVDRLNNPFTQDYVQNLFRLAREAGVGFASAGKTTLAARIDSGVARVINWALSPFESGEDWSDQGSQNHSGGGNPGDRASTREVERDGRETGMIERAVTVAAPTALELPADRNVWHALEDFRAVKQGWLRMAVTVLPMISLTILGLDLVLLQGQLFFPNPIRATSSAGVAIALLFARRLFQSLPEELGTLWRRGVLREKDGSPVRPDHYAALVTAFGDELNGRWAWIFGLAVLLFSSVSLTLRMQVLGYSGVLAPLQAFWIETRSGGIPALMNWGLILTDLCGAFVLGHVGWRMLVIARRILSWLKELAFEIQPDHPDESGGLSPLGHLCFSNAILLMIPAVYLTGWIVVLKYQRFLIQDLQRATVFWFPNLNRYLFYVDSGLFQVALIGILLAALLMFILPVWGIHCEMRRQRRKILARLEELNCRISTASYDLFFLESADPAELKKRVESIDLMRRISQNYKRVPEWPFDTTMALRFTTSQVVSLLGLVGAGTPVLNLIQNLLAQLLGSGN